MQSEFGLSQDWTPGKLNFNTKNILDASEKYILNSVHIWDFDEFPDYQNYFNKYIFAKYDYADCYSPTHPDIESSRGDIAVQGTGRKQRYVINMYTKRFADVFEDKHLYEKFFDTPNYRMRYFVHAMNQVFKIKNLNSIAMQEKFVNDKIDVNWNRYVDVLTKYAKKFPQIKIAIYSGKFSESVLLLKSERAAAAAAAALRKEAKAAKAAATAAKQEAQTANAAEKVAEKV